MSTEQMRFASGVSANADPGKALDALLGQLASQLQGADCHLAVLFVSALYRTNWEALLRRIRERLNHPMLIGCSAGGVLGADQELEATPAISMIAASLPRVRLHPFAIEPNELEESQGPGYWIEKFGATPAQEPVGILLPEPFSCDAMALIGRLNDVYPRMPLIGGLASGAEQPGGHRLFLDEQVLQVGAAGVLLTGDIRLQTIVSQGCRPIGRPLIVTKAQENVILELAGLPAIEALRQLFLTLPEPDRALAQQALFLGIVMNEQQAAFQRGDFVIRNLVGIDPSTGALAVGDRVHVGQTVQFQLRDAASSREDLRQLLREHASPPAQEPAAGGLLFSCLGRGKDLYGEPHYDIRTIQAAIGARPIAGFFCNGEIGPVGGRNFVHGFTSSLGLFRPKSSA